jgi:hypothetical protein
MNCIAVAQLTSEAFAPFGDVGTPHADKVTPQVMSRSTCRAGRRGASRASRPRLRRRGAARSGHAMSRRSRWRAVADDGYFTEPVRDFYNLAMVDTNIADYTVWRPVAPLEFAT